ncbi:hypothetical protein [Nostoc sp. ChiQUE01b]|uniref:hypothetical protein n=1 Tax=Nostoc sp. ChiQUE01b TaxID=3075376 RepID=UPI002AD3BB85|nr:hypothetical protein [Nostoc sp. ChiQUE01b]MDZ8260420.1 hypothetical protein [Nostoc sp. ChiQUE01b]
MTKAIHNWENRFVIDGATSGSGVYPATVGVDVTADGPSWQLRGEYRESPADSWKPDEMMIDPGLERVDIQAIIGAEDPLPERDFEDIQWQAEYLDGTMLDIPYRPYAIRPEDLFQMPDGIFETAFGTYYMGVRVVNRWGLPFTNNHVLDISAASRAELAMRGVQIIDAWSHAELTALGQTQNGTGMVLGPLVPGAARTVYFKVNVTNAAPRKHQVEFICRNMMGMADPNHPARRVRKQIFVSRTTADTATGELVAEVQEGTLRFKLKELAIDMKNGRKGRRRCPPSKRRKQDSGTIDTLRHTLQALLDGKPVDPCVIQQILACYCTVVPRDDGRGSIDPFNPRDGRFCYKPIYAFPTKFSYSVIPRTPFPGQYGPIPFDDPWWKVLLLIIALILFIAGASSEAADTAYQDEDLVIGTLGRTQRDDVDAALCMLDTDRALAFLQTLDAQSNEDFQNAIISLNGNIDLVGPVMTRTELDALMLLPIDAPERKLHKSGGRTGLTHGIISGFAPTGHDLATWNIDQVIIISDPDFGEPVSDHGDSGSVWVHTSSRRPVGLNHSGNDDNMMAFASLLADVQTRMNITI